MTEGAVRLLCYIRPQDCEEYLHQGWQVHTLPGNHGFYSMLAWRDLDEY